jgi:hypothetical protein
MTLIIVAASPAQLVDIARMRQQVLAADQRRLARLGPLLLLAEAGEPDAVPADAVPLDVVGDLGAHDGLAVDAHDDGRLRVHDELAQALEEDDHGAVEPAAEERDRHGELARRVELVHARALAAAAAAAALPVPVPARGRRRGGQDLDDLGRRAHRAQAVAAEAEVEAARDRVEQQQRVAPRGVDLGPLDGRRARGPGAPARRRQPPEPQAVDGAEEAVVADGEGVVVHVGALQPAQPARVVRGPGRQRVALAGVPGHGVGVRVARRPAPGLVGRARALLRVEREQLLLERGPVELELPQLLERPSFVVGGVGELALGARDVLGRGHVGVGLAQELDVGVALAHGAVEPPLQAVDEQVGALEAQRVVDVGARREDLEDVLGGVERVAERPGGGGRRLLCGRLGLLGGLGRGRRRDGDLGVRQHDEGHGRRVLGRALVRVRGERGLLEDGRGGIFGDGVVFSEALLLVRREGLAAGLESRGVGRSGRICEQSANASARGGGDGTVEKLEGGRVEVLEGGV